MTHRPRSAEDLLRDLAITTPEEIDLEVIARCQNARVKYRELDGCEAYLTGDARLGRAIIAVDDRASWRRQRFSIAHELGHWERHRGLNLYCTKEDIGAGRGVSSMPREKPANQFAADLLMPEFMLRFARRDFLRFDMRAVRQLGERFDVSKPAMAYRLVELEFEPSILACYGRHGLKWRVASKSVGHKWSWPRRLLDPQSNAHAILYEDAPDDRVMSDLDADTWFDLVGAETIEVGEQSFRSGDEVYALLVLRSDRMLAD